MRIKEYDFDIDNEDDNGLFTVGAVAGAGALTLNGALIVGGTYTSVDGLGHMIDILSAGNDAGITFTIVGTDQDNVAQTDIVTGAAGAPGTAQSAIYFKTISSITASGAAAGNVTIGTTDEVQSQILPLDSYADNQAMLGANVTGTIDFDLQYTCQPILQPGVVPVWFQQTATPDFAGATADVCGLMPLHITAWKLVVNSYTNGAEIQVTRNQPTNT